MITTHAKSEHHAKADNIFLTGNVAAYDIWRAQKLSNYPAGPAELMVTINDLDAPTSAETDLIRANCIRTNMSFYRIASNSNGNGNKDSTQDHDQQATRKSLKNFAKTFGLDKTEAHRSAGDDDIVALEVTTNKAQAGYIPYTNRRLSWHTDGYYNFHGPDDAIRAILMHCARPADQGGENAYLDPHIAYIRLRDENPDFIKALMSPKAMSIPENREENGALRPTNTGPVFFIDSEAQLNMRFSARTRHIIWQDNPITRQAIEFLNEVMTDDPLIIRYRLSRGEGVLCNNVLHNRTGFDKQQQINSNRLIYRARYYQRIN